MICGCYAEAMTEADLFIQSFWPAWRPLTLIELIPLGISVLVLVFSRKLLEKFWHSSSDSSQLNSRLKVFRAFNFLVIFAILLNHFIFSDSSSGWAQKLFGVVMVVFSAFWATQIARYFILRRYGKSRESNSEKVFSETYNSRLLSLLATLFIIVFALVGFVQVLGFDDLLKTTGVIGIIGVMLAMTQAAWAPDIISGLIILNSGLVEEGDVIEFNDNEDIVAIVFKTKLFHTELLNLASNHRIMLSNAKLRGKLIRNLSKFASAKGLREVLRFKIGYDVGTDEIRGAFNEAYENACADSSIQIEANHDMELRVEETDNYAVEWAIYYYTKGIRDLIKTRQQFRAEILNVFTKRGISLATPDLRHIFQDATVARPDHGVEQTSRNIGAQV